MRGLPQGKRSESRKWAEALGTPGPPQAVCTHQHQQQKSVLVQRQWGGAGAEGLSAVLTIVTNGPAVKRIHWQSGRHIRCRSESWVGKIPWRRAWRPTPVFSPGESPRTEEPGGLQSWTRLKPLSTRTHRIPVLHHIRAGETSEPDSNFPKVT